MEGKFVWNVDLITVLKIIFTQDSVKDWRKWTNMPNKILENVLRKWNLTCFLKSLKPLKMDSKTTSFVKPIPLNVALVILKLFLLEIKNKLIALSY